MLLIFKKGTRKCASLAYEKFFISITVISEFWQFIQNVKQKDYNLSICSRFSMFLWFHLNHLKQSLEYTWKTLLKKFSRATIIAHSLPKAPSERVNRMYIQYTNVIIKILQRIQQPKQTQWYNTRIGCVTKCSRFNDSRSRLTWLAKFSPFQ